MNNEDLFCEQSISSHHHSLLSRGSHIVDLEDHLDQLGGQEELGLLGVKGLDHVLLAHV